MLDNLDSNAGRGSSVSLLADRRFDAPNRVSLGRDGNGNPQLTLATDFDRAWSAIGRALQDADIRVDDLNRSLGVYYVNLAEGARQPDEKPGLFSRLFGGESDRDAVDARAERYQLRLTTLGSSVQVSLDKDSETVAPAMWPAACWACSRSAWTDPSSVQPSTATGETPRVSPVLFARNGTADMSTPTTLSLKKIYSGKVRDLYEIDDKRMLMVASDRLSAFDVILEQPIPEKGKILTAISNFWFDKLKDLVPNHFTGDRVEDVVPAAELALVEGRAVVAKRLKPVPVEAIVRGYLVGSGWKEYQKSGTVCGIALPAGLKEAAKLPQPIFTPSTKAAVGDHDENICFAQCEALIGAELAAQVRDTAIALYSAAVEYAATRGILIADTKFEFGLDRGRYPDPDGRGADPRLQPFLAGRQLRRGQQPAELRQAVRPRLAGVHRLEQAAAGPGGARRSGAEDRRQVSRGADPG